MRNLIYQQWAGTPKASAYAGAQAMAEYAARIGAAHEFVVRPRPVHNVGPGSKFYDKFLPLWAESGGGARGTHDHYDHILFADTDLFPVADLTANIFEGFDGEVGICTEPMQPDLRRKATRGICLKGDEDWAAMVKHELGGIMPRRPDGLLKVYNAGLVLWSRAGLLRARERFLGPLDYVTLCSKHQLYPFYQHDQNWLHAMIFTHDMDVRELDNEWNRYVHYETKDRQIIRVIDPRTPATRMVHIQLRGADEYDAETLQRVTNLPQAEWKLPR